MANDFTVKIDGMEEVLKKLDVKKFERDITDELAAFGKDVERDAKNNLSLNGTVDYGFLSNSIGSETRAPLTVSIFVHKDYAAYVEFGTGQYAANYVPSLEPEWQILARSFYVNGKGRMPAQPYLHPAVEKNYPELIKNLKTLIVD